jgi:hypothetical protein
MGWFLLPTTLSPHPLIVFLILRYALCSLPYVPLLYGLSLWAVCFYIPQSAFRIKEGR